MEYKVLPDLYEGNDIQEALAYSMTDNATGLLVDGEEVNAQEYFDEQDEAVKIESYLNYISDAHIEITDIIEGDEASLYLFRYNSDEESACIIYHEEKDMVFHLLDWRGGRPESFSEIGKYDWVVGEEGRRAFIMNGLPRVFI